MSSCAKEGGAIEVTGIVPDEERLSLRRIYFPFNE